MKNLLTDRTIKFMGRTKANELTPEEFQQIYDEMQTQYHVVMGATNKLLEIRDKKLSMFQMQNGNSSQLWGKLQQIVEGLWAVKNFFHDFARMKNEFSQKSLRVKLGTNSARPMTYNGYERILKAVNNMDNDLRKSANTAINIRDQDLTAVPSDKDAPEQKLRDYIQEIIGGLQKSRSAIVAIQNMNNSETWNNRE